MSRRKSIPADGTSIVADVDGKSDSGNNDAVVASATSDSSASVSNTIDPASVPNGGDNSNDGGTVKRRRGRPPGSTNASTKPQAPADINGIERLLYSIHSVAAILIAPEMGMETSECREVAAAITAVNRHYNVKLLDQKTADWLHLTQVIGVAYFGRIMAIRERRKMVTVAQQRPRAQSQNPVPGNPAAPEVSNIVDIPGFTRQPGNGTRQGEIAGLGIVEFPADHELAPKGGH